MKSVAQIIVHGAFANHLGIVQEAIDETQRIGQDLGLDSFDLVLVALGFEGLDVEQGEFPVEKLEGVRTVGDVTSLFEAWWKPGGRQARRDLGDYRPLDESFHDRESFA